jgi:hypothetical protein
VRLGETLTVDERLRAYILLRMAFVDNGNGPQVTGVPSAPTPIQVPMPPSASQFSNQNHFPSTPLIPRSTLPPLPPLPTQNFGPRNSH